MTETEVILAKTIYGEARGEHITGKEAIASVILNRVKFSEQNGGYWWGNSIKEVCLKPWQFSCWNKNDPNYPKLMALGDTDDVYLICKRIASRAVSGLLRDNVCGATHYHTKKITPRWSVGKIPCATIGNHVFYNDIEK